MYTRARRSRDIPLLGSSEAELEDKRDHYYPAYDRVGKRESDDRSGRIPLKSGGLDSLHVPPIPGIFPLSVAVACYTLSRKKKKMII